jgi:hypothetical protein
MAKNRKIDGLWIQDPPELEAIRKSLTNTLRNVVSFSPIAQPRGGYRYHAISGEEVRTSPGQSEQERIYPAFLLYATDSVRFWVSCSLLSRSERGASVVDEASVIVLAGTLSTDVRELLRAEWDSFDSPHAQPHWHVYGSRVAEMFQRPEGEVGSDMRLNLSRFHFAMSARWMDHTGGHRETVSGMGVARWLPACIEYTRAQIEYLAERALSPADNLA